MKIFNFLNKKKKNQFSRNNERYYKIVIGIIISSYLFIFGLNFLNPNEGKFLATENGEVIQAEMGGQFKVINRYYDKKNQRYQVILWLAGDRQLKEDYQLELSAKSVTKVNLNEEKKSKVTRIGRQYFSIVVSDIPENYEAVRTELTIKKESTTSESDVESSVKLYSKESQTSLQTIEESKNYFKEQAKEVQLSQLDLEVSELKKVNKTLRADIEKTEELTKEIEADMVLQLSDEREESSRVIEENKSLIAQKENEILENLEKMNELEENKKQVEANF